MQQKYRKYRRWKISRRNYEVGWDMLDLFIDGERTVERDFYYVQHFLRSPGENGVFSFCSCTANTSHMEAQNTSSGIRLPLNGSRDRWALQSDVSTLVSVTHVPCHGPRIPAGRGELRLTVHDLLGICFGWDYHPGIFLASYLIDGKRQDNSHWTLSHCLETVRFWGPHWSCYWANTDWCQRLLLRQLNLYGYRRVSYY